MNARLAHYRLGDVIGAGSFATVHLAVDERLEDTVAIKILAENHSLNPEIRERFIAEGRSLRRVGGAHVVSVYDIGESERMQPYLVLELADRGSVRDRVESLRRRGWRAGPADLLAFARMLAEAVAAVHAARLVHRDLSPGNLLLTSRTGGRAGEPGSANSALIRPDERLVIADLGMCKDLAVSSGLTVAGGTDGFRPPEQDGPGVVDIRADVWAMSALLTWIAGGRRELGGRLAKVLHRGMSDRPSRRQPDAAQWLREVESALEPRSDDPAQSDGCAVPGPSTAVSGPTSVRPQESAPRRRPLVSIGRRWKVAMATSAILLAVAAGAVLDRTLLVPAQLPAARIGAASIDIRGPETIAVGETATFTAELDGVRSWVWTLPDQRFVVDSRSVEITASSAGTGELILRAQTPEGRELEVRRSVTVTE